MNKNLKLKAAVEDVRMACFNGDRITGTEIKKKYGISTHLLPVMVDAGYIQKIKGLKYKWKVQAEILPVMLKRIQDDITAKNMEYLKRGQENKAKAQKKEDLKRSVEYHIERKKVMDAIKNINVAPVKIPNPQITNYSEKQPHIPTPTVVFEQPKTTTVSYDEVIKKIDNLSNTIHQKWVQMEFKDREISDLKRQLSENSGRKFILKLFGLPIFAINRS
jgi:hypothetical protein